eukprot:5020292-Alexandrium_andersonii.AAC.1
MLPKRLAAGLAPGPGYRPQRRTNPRPDQAVGPRPPMQTEPRPERESAAFRFRSILATACPAKFPRGISGA